MRLYLRKWRACRHRGDALDHVLTNQRFPGGGTLATPWSTLTFATLARLQPGQQACFR
jgi:hypothetical protein